jgi:molybdopterin-guanine dinucleotide biosynthesis protein A
MGRDKAELALEGRSLLARGLACLSAVAHPVRLACGASERYRESGHERVLDSGPDGGPLAGLLAGLERARGDLVAVLAVDMPGVRPEHFTALADLAGREDLDVALLSGARGDEPLCSVVHRRVAPLVRAALERGERRMVAFHGPGVRVGRLAAELASDGVEACRNLNTPAEFEAWRATRSRALESVAR